MRPTLSLICAGIAFFALLLGFIPLLGWTNWFLTVPVGIVGLILASTANFRPGTLSNGVILGVAALRLFLGGGLI